MSWYELVVPVDPVGFWTMALTVATVGLIVVAGRGLRSLHLAKVDINARSQREARSCAIARCEEMATEIISTTGEIITRLVALKLPLFVQSGDAVRFDPDASEQVGKAQSWLAQVPPDLYSDCIKLLNKIEAWSMYFTNGVADHEIAFGPCAPVFCSMIVRFYPILLVRRAGNSSGQFPNAVKLFKNWRAQLDDQQHGQRLQALIQGMQDLQNRREAQAREAQPTLPPPIGTGI
jgi:hypothetical protein